MTFLPGHKSAEILPVRVTAATIRRQVHVRFTPLGSVPNPSLGMAHGTLLASFDSEIMAGGLGAALRHPSVPSITTIMGAQETIMKGFLIFAGSLAMLVGLVAMIEGNLHCLGFLWRKKGRP
jgi:hypothetical protein